MSQGTTKGVPIDTDPTMALNSNQVVPSQAAVVSYVAANGGGGGGGSQVAFYAYMSAATQATTGLTTVQADTELFDIGSNYNNATYTFTAPTTGVYMFGAGVYFSNTQFYVAQFVATSTTVGLNFNHSAGAQQSGINHTALIQMTAGDTCVFQAGSNAGINIQNAGFIGPANQTFWYGYQVA
jgi:hypothetical protein